MLERCTSAVEVVWNCLAEDQRGATAIEYGLVAGLIGAILAVVLLATGLTLQDIYENIMEAVLTASSSL